MIWEELENCAPGLAPGSVQKRKFICSSCGKEIIQPVTHIVYKSDFDKAKFCSYNCRCRYYEKYKKERNLYKQKRYEELFQPNLKKSKMNEKEA